MLYSEFLENTKAKDTAYNYKVYRQLEAIRPALEEINKAIEAANETNTHYTIQSYIKGYLRIL